MQVVGQYVGEPFDLDRDLPLAEALRTRPPVAIRGDLQAAAQKASVLGKRTLKAFVYHEVPDADQFTIGAVSVPAILDCFDRVGATRC